MVDKRDSVRAPTGQATHASHGAAEASPPSGEYPSRRLRYEVRKPRGFDSVWDFLCEQPEGTFGSGPLSICARYGYERARDLRLFAEGHQIGHGLELWERFAALEPVFHAFWDDLEQAADKWRAEKIATEKSAEADQVRKDAALCERVLALAIPTQRAETRSRLRSWVARAAGNAQPQSGASNV